MGDASLKQRKTQEKFSTSYQKKKYIYNLKITIVNMTRRERLKSYGGGSETPCSAKEGVRYGGC